MHSTSPSSGQSLHQVLLHTYRGLKGRPICLFSSLAVLRRPSGDDEHRPKHPNLPPAPHHRFQLRCAASSRCPRFVASLQSGRRGGAISSRTPCRLCMLQLLFSGDAFSVAASRTCGENTKTRCNLACWGLGSFTGKSFMYGAGLQR